MLLNETAMAHNHRSTEVTGSPWLADYRDRNESDDDSDDQGKEESGGVSSLGSLNNPNHKDIADYIAEEKIT